MPVFTAIFERVAGNLLSVDGSATQLPAILLGVDAPLRENKSLLVLVHVVHNSISKVYSVSFQAKPRTPREAKQK